MDRKLEELMYDAVKDVQLQRARIIEDYIKFWLAAQVPDDYLTPEWLADNIQLVERVSDDCRTRRFCVEFKR